MCFRVCDAFCDHNRAAMCVSVLVWCVRSCVCVRVCACVCVCVWIKYEKKNEEESSAMCLIVEVVTLILRLHCVAL